MAYQNSPRIVTDGLVLCLDAGNTKSYSGSGTDWADLSRNGNNGTLTNGPTFNSTNGGSIVFDGTDDRVTFNTITALSAWTVTIIVSTNKINTGTVYYPFGFSTTNTYAGGIGMGGTYAGNNGNTIYVYDGSSVGGAVTLNYTLTAGRLMNITVTQSSSAYNIFVNGTPQISGTLTSQSLSIVRLGSRTDSQWPFDGNIAYTNIYSRVLSNAEVLQNYNATKSRFGL